MKRKSVVILYKYIPQYRLSFFRHLQDLCNGSAIDLKIIYGDPGREDASKGNAVNFEPGVFRKNNFLTVGQTEFIWQPVLSEIHSADLVIVEQANKLLFNYILIARQLLGIQRLAFWGHGRNLQAAKPDGIREKVKKLMLPVPHWWFAYTDGTARYLSEAGFPSERTTVVYNSIDTKELIDLRSGIHDRDIAETRDRLAISSDEVCIYVGSIYPEKRIEFLLEACKRIRESIPNFNMIFVGTGSDVGLVKRFCEHNSWSIFVGPAFGVEMVKYAAIAQLLLMPGLVGLAILDSFALAIPIVTTNIHWHSPEIEYLENGTNGVMVSPPEDVDLYASTVVGLLRDKDRRTKIADNCALSASVYTTEKMAARFFEGVTQALI